MRKILKIITAVGFAALLSFSLPLAAKAQRVALVIGNGQYEHVGILANPVNDATDIAEKLRSLGFEVVAHNNVKMREIGSVLSEFSGKLSPGAVALVFYAGHGLQIKGENYFPTVDANINSEMDVPNQREMEKNNHPIKYLF